jgi:hypothetical protein
MCVQHDAIDDPGVVAHTSSVLNRWRCVEVATLQVQERVLCITVSSRSSPSVTLLLLKSRLEPYKRCCRTGVVPRTQRSQAPVGPRGLHKDLPLCQGACLCVYVPRFNQAAPAHRSNILLPSRPTCSRRSMPETMGESTSETFAGLSHCKCRVLVF